MRFSATHLLCAAVLLVRAADAAPLLEKLFFMEDMATVASRAEVGVSTALAQAERGAASLAHVEGSAAAALAHAEGSAAHALASAEGSAAGAVVHAEGSAGSALVAHEGSAGSALVTAEGSAVSGVAHGEGSGASGVGESESTFAKEGSFVFGQNVASAASDAKKEAKRVTVHVFHEAEKVFHETEPVTAGTGERILVGKLDDKTKKKKIPGQEAQKEVPGAQTGAVPGAPDASAAPAA